MSKILRALRFVNFFNELRVILCALLGSIVSLFWSIVTLAFILFVFSLVIVQAAANYLHDDQSDLALKEAIRDQVVSVSDTMLTLYKGMSGDSPWELHAILAGISPLYGWLYCIFVLFVQFSLMNIVTGVFVEKAMALAKPDWKALSQQNFKDELDTAQEIKQFFAEMDDDGNGLLTVSELNEHLKDPRLASCLDLLGIDISTADYFYDVLGVPRGETLEGERAATIPEVVHGIMKLKGRSANLDMHFLLMTINRLTVNQVDLQRSVSALTRGVNGQPALIEAPLKAEV